MTFAGAASVTGEGAPLAPRASAPATDSRASRVDTRDSYTGLVESVPGASDGSTCNLEDSLG